MEMKVSANIQAAYDEQYTQDLAEWRELGAKYKAQNILELCGSVPFARVLEVGAGEGSILMHLDRAGFGGELHALELSKSGVERIRERRLPRVKSVEQFNGYQIPFEDGSFDLVILSHVIEHVEFPRLLLREIRRVSRFQLFEVPLDYSFDVDQKVAHFLGYGHINIFTPTLLRFLLRSEGFKILKGQSQLMPLEILAYLAQRQGRGSLLGRLRLRLSLLPRDVLYRVSGQEKQEKIASAYAVHTESEASSPLISTTQEST
jgi:ubiquinone/menaquinone biosynthesis C-methylase UbiE